MLCPCPHIVWAACCQEQVQALYRTAPIAPHYLLMQTKPTSRMNSRHWTLSASAEPIALGNLSTRPLDGPCGNQKCWLQRAIHQWHSSSMLWNFIRYKNSSNDKTDTKKNASICDISPVSCSYYPMQSGPVVQEPCFYWYSEQGTLLHCQVKPRCLPSCSQHAGCCRYHSGMPSSPL